MTDIRTRVREDYTNILEKSMQSQSEHPSGTEDISKSVGYSEEELEVVPPEANLGLGCGNPLPGAQLKEGEVVVDLGSGAGLDCFLAGVKVGRRGRVIGVDMTAEMISTSRQTAKKHKIRNVEFRLGEIENLPVANDYADVCMSNCVINLSQKKGRVYQEIFRILKPGGRISISDIVVMRKLPQDILDDPDMHSC
nr:methyltransferase domain-containing protein [uncultured Sellimonas sp.]